MGSFFSHMAYHILNRMWLSRNFVDLRFAFAKRFVETKDMVSLRKLI